MRYLYKQIEILKSFECVSFWRQNNKHLFVKLLVHYIRTVSYFCGRNLGLLQEIFKL